MKTNFKAIAMLVMSAGTALLLSMFFLYDYHNWVFVMVIPLTILLSVWKLPVAGGSTATGLSLFSLFFLFAGGGELIPAARLISIIVSLAFLFGGVVSLVCYLRRDDSRI
jgi:hypothetical protein